MYGKPAMTSFKYQVYLYGSEAITYLSAILWVVTASTMSHQTAPTPHYRQPSSTVYGSITFTHLKKNLYVKNQRENLYGCGTITCKTTIPKPRV